MCISEANVQNFEWKSFFHDSLNAMPCYQKTLKYNLYSISYVISKQKFEMKLMKLVDATFTFWCGKTGMPNKFGPTGLYPWQYKPEQSS